ncbi:hypothetical protein BWU74_05265 [Paraburkholderia caledonica]|nr:hypothetical protein BWU74_05265 [Burkholderia sp. Bk]
MYTPASGKKQVTDLRELRNASHRLRHWNPRSKSTALHAPLLAGRLIAARRKAQETSKPLAPYAVEHKLKLLISYRTVL